jgi:ribosome-binding protein aMBF1 (putative translation factor)
MEHINRPMSEEERQRAAEVRARVKNEFPPKHVEHRPAPAGIPRQIHDARKRRGLSRYGLGQITGVPSTTVRAIEQSDESVRLAQLKKVAEALGLTVELVEQT